MRVVGDSVVDGLEMGEMLTMRSSDGTFASEQGRNMCAPLHSPGRWIQIIARSCGCEGVTSRQFRLKIINKQFSKEKRTNVDIERLHCLRMFSWAKVFN